MPDHLDLNPYYSDDAADRHERAEYGEWMRASDERNRVEPDWKPARRVRRAAANKGDAPGLWRDAVLNRDQGCRVHENPADCADGWAAHHVVPQQELRRTLPEALWNPLSGMGVCGKAHRQHHNLSRRITLNEIPVVVQAYLRHHGFGPYLDRHYDLDWF